MPGTLVHSPADIVAQLLVDLRIGVDPDLDVDGDWPIYVSGEPDMPDDCVTVYDTEGRDHGRTMSDGERQEMHGFQVRVRSRLQTDGFSKVREIAVAFDENVDKDEVFLDEIDYLVWSITRPGNPMFIGKEEGRTRRTVHTLNALVSVRLVTELGYAILTEDGETILRELGDAVLLESVE